MWIFLTSYPLGDIWEEQLWGPIREETTSWFARIYNGLNTPHTTAEDGHRNLILSMAMDLSAEREEPVKLPVSLEEFYEQITFYGIWF